MRTYTLNNGAITLQGNYKQGDITKALDMSNIGKDGKPRLVTIKITSLKEVVKDVFYMGECEILQAQQQSNILTYNLYFIEDLQSNDLLQASTINFMKKYGYALFFQSSGYRDTTNNESVSLSGQIKLLEHTINYYVKEDLKDSRIAPRFRGSHKDFIKYCEDNKLTDVLKQYEEMIKLARSK